MEISEVRIKLMEEAGERLQAFCSITFDHCFVIRDLKIIEGTNGPFVAMPSRKLTAHCAACGCKNHLRACYCNQCGTRLNADRVVKEEDGRAKLYADIAHPINSSCRDMIQQRVIQSFRDELDRSKLPGYISTYDDFDEEVVSVPYGSARRPHERAAPEAPAATGRAPAAKIDRAESTPPPPHAMPAPQRGLHRAAKAHHAPPAADASQAKPNRGDSFGAGIL